MTARRVDAWIASQRRTRLGYQAAQNRLKPLTPLRGEFLCYFLSSLKESRLKK